MSLGHDNRVGPWPALTAKDTKRLVRMYQAGARVADIAETLGISVRTAQRYRDAAIVAVVVGDWRLTYMLRPNRAPALLERLHVR